MPHRYYVLVHDLKNPIGPLVERAMAWMLRSNIGSRGS